MAMNVCVFIKRKEERKGGKNGISKPVINNLTNAISYLIYILLHKCMKMQKKV